MDYETHPGRLSLRKTRCTKPTISFIIIDLASLRVSSGLRTRGTGRLSGIFGLRPVRIFFLLRHVICSFLSTPPRRPSCLRELKYVQAIDNDRGLKNSPRERDSATLNKVAVARTCLQCPLPLSDAHRRLVVRRSPPRGRRSRRRRPIVISFHRHPRTSESRR